MAVERKCKNCGVWNQENDYCTACNSLISPMIIEEQREALREKVREDKPPTKLDIWMDQWKNSRFLLVRVFYKIVYTISVIFFAIASFFAWMAVSPNG